MQHKVLLNSLQESYPLLVRLTGVPMGMLTAQHLGAKPGGVEAKVLVLLRWQLR